MGERLESIGTSLNRVQDQTTAHRDKINSLKNRQCTGAHTTCEENREVIDFQNYRRNPMLFLERVEEKIAKNEALAVPYVCLLYTSCLYLRKLS